MPEITPSMYPFIAAGAGAIAVLLGLVVVARRRRARRDGVLGESDSAGTGQGPVGAVVDRAPVDDETHADSGPDDLQAGADGTPSAAKQSEKLVAWGPDETGPARLKEGAEPRRGAETETPGDIAAGQRVFENGPGAEVAAGSPAGRDTTAAASPQVTPESESAMESGTTSRAAELREDLAGPEGQPFEREGRWWFRRDDELLVYDDATSEWKAAPASPGGSSPRAPASDGDGDPAARAETADVGANVATIDGEEPVATESALRPRPEGATSWKCPTCGATNGSASGNCRMCFAARA